MNVLGYLWFLNFFIGNDFVFYGYEVVKRFFNGEENYIGILWFLIVMFCDLEIR